MTTLQRTRCSGTYQCPACGHPCRQQRSNHFAFCRCCEVRLTDRERNTLSFYGNWRTQPWAKVLNNKLNTYGAWTKYVRAMTHVLQSLVSEESSDT